MMDTLRLLASRSLAVAVLATALTVAGCADGTSSVPVATPGPRAPAPTNPPAPTNDPDEELVAKPTEEAPEPASETGAEEPAGGSNGNGSNGGGGENGSGGTGGERPAGEPIPEPATVFLVGSGLAGAAVAARRRKKQGEDAEQTENAPEQSGDDWADGPPPMRWVSDKS